MIWWLLTEWSALFILECILEQPIRFFRVKEQQTIDWTLGENEIYDNFCPGGFSYSFGGNSHFFESKRSSYTMNSSGFILYVMMQLHPSCASLLLWAANYELNYKGVSLHCSSITKLHLISHWIKNEVKLSFIFIFKARVWKWTVKLSPSIKGTMEWHDNTQNHKFNIYMVYFLEIAINFLL